MEKFKSLYKFISKKFQTMHLEYKVNVRPRYGHGKAPHGLLYDYINGNRNMYESLLKHFLKYRESLQLIKQLDKEQDESKPVWNNGYLPGMDIIGIYGMLANFKPGKYIEIGSGNSTKVARKAIMENNLSTEIISIDPFPRANIDHIADTVIRKPFESLDDYSFITDKLEENDILFIDNSHRCFPNSDVMVCFLEIIPRLKKGVIVQIHDVYLPYDYPQFMCDRFYNEQYMLASILLANHEKYKTILPNYFISEDFRLKEITRPFWDHPNLKGVEQHGGSFWFKIAD